MNRIHGGAAFTVLVLAGVVAGCRLTGDDAPATKTSVEFVGGSADFFPAAIQGSFLTGYYKDVFSRMHEPSLLGARIPAGMTVIRLLWIRSFDPAVSIRIMMTAARCAISTTIDGERTDEYGPPNSYGAMEFLSSHYGPSLRRDSSDLDLERCARVHTNAIGARLWSGAITDTVAGLDGDEVVFEIADSSGYHIAMRWTPGRDRSPEFREVWARFIEVANVNAEPFKKGVW